MTGGYNEDAETRLYIELLQEFYNTKCKVCIKRADCCQEVANVTAIRRCQDFGLFDDGTT